MRQLTLCLVVAPFPLGAVCPVNTFGSSTPGGTNCTSCPAGTFTTSTGTSDVNNCLCKAGFEGVNGDVCTGTSRGSGSVGRTTGNCGD